MTGPVHSVSKAFDILRVLADAEAMTLSDVARAVGLGPSSCLNLLKTLVAEGAADRDDLTKRYKLASAWHGLGALGQEGATQLIERARPVLARFAQSAEAAVGLWKVASRDRAQLVARAESDAGMRLSLADDQRQPLGMGAVGRAIAAMEGAGKAELERRFALVRWQANIPFDDYLQQIQEAAVAGFAVDQEYAHSGVCTIAVGIADIPPGFCISASFLTGSRGPADIHSLGAVLLLLRDGLIKDLR